MSYEGYVQCICKNGHYWEIDAYEEDRCWDDGDEVLQRCPKCQAPRVWRNGVSLTNCCFGRGEPECDCGLTLEEQEECCGRGAGYVDICNYVKNTAVCEKCPTCGHVKEVQPDIYDVDKLLRDGKGRKR